MGRRLAKNSKSSASPKSASAPYFRMICPSEGGGYFAKMLELPECYAQGESIQEAYDSLNEMADIWLEDAAKRGTPIPSPAGVAKVGGRYVLRLPISVHEKAADLAAFEGVSLNQWLLSAISERIGAKNMESRIEVLINQWLDHLSLYCQSFTQETATVKPGEDELTIRRTVKKIVLATTIASEAQTDKSIPPPLASR
jgi:antitoxin HicB